MTGDPVLTAELAFEINHEPGKNVIIESCNPTKWIFLLKLVSVYKPGQWCRWCGKQGPLGSFVIEPVCSAAVQAPSLMSKPELEFEVDILPVGLFFPSAPVIGILFLFQFTGQKISLKRPVKRPVSAEFDRKHIDSGSNSIDELRCGKITVGCAQITIDL